MDPETLKEEFSQALAGELVECLSAKNVRSQDPSFLRQYEATRYPLSAGGKRLRPLLVLASSHAYGGDWRQALGPAAALEMIHTYSLVHDDLPAMDDDSVRRGKPTTHVAFDEATAVLAGDGLLTRAFEWVAREDYVEKVGAEKSVLALRLLSNAAGLDGMVGGQAMDIGGAVASAADIEEVHRLKTGALLGCAIALGAVVAGEDKASIAKAFLVGERAGVAFQIVDDILDATQSSEVLGKTAGIDAQNDKMNYVAKLGLEASRRRAKELGEEALDLLPKNDDKGELLRYFVRKLVVRDR